MFTRYAKVVCAATLPAVFWKETVMKHTTFPVDSDSMMQWLMTVR